jgi:hypothetical protein
MSAIATTRSPNRVSLDDLYERYCDDALADIPTAELILSDRRFFAARGRAGPVIRVVGVDVAERALAYGRRVGALDEVFAADLERGPAPAGLAERLAETDLVTVVGGLSYIGPQTMGKLLAATNAERRPWVACFPLRITPFDRIAKVLQSFGLMVERWDRPVRQRRMRDEDERRRVLAALAARGIDPSQREDKGWYYADAYLARPVDSVRRLPIAKLLAGVA